MLNKVIIYTDVDRNGSYYNYHLKHLMTLHYSPDDGFIACTSKSIRNSYSNMTMQVAITQF